VPDSVLASLDHADHTRRWRQIIERNSENTARFVAEVPVVGIVGFVDCGPLRYEGAGQGGEITAIYVLGSAQRRGVGRALMSAAAGALRSFDMTGLTAWVLADNRPARQFYEALGGVQTKETSITIGKELSEIAYFWRTYSSAGTSL